MKALSGKDLARLLEEHGWVLKRVHGSHHVYMKDGKRERISIPIHGKESLKKGLLVSLLRLADVKLT